MTHVRRPAHLHPRKRRAHHLSDVDPPPPPTTCCPSSHASPPTLTLAFAPLFLVALLRALLAVFGLPAAPAAYGSYSELAVTMAGLVAPTAALCLIHLATLTGESRTQFFGLAVGFTLFACITAYGAGSNLFNPAISIGSYLARGLLGSGFAAPLAELSFLLTGGLAGALAALAFNASSAEGTVGVVSTEFLGTLLATALVITTADSPGGTMAQAVGLGYAALTFFGAEISEVGGGIIPP